MRMAPIAAASTNDGLHQLRLPPMKERRGTKVSVTSSMTVTKPSHCERRSNKPEPTSLGLTSGPSTNAGLSTASFSTTWGPSRTTCISRPSRLPLWGNKASPNRTTFRLNSTPRETTSRTPFSASSPAPPSKILRNAWNDGTKATTVSSTTPRRIACNRGQVG